MASIRRKSNDEWEARAHHAKNMHCCLHASASAGQRVNEHEEGDR